MKTKFPILEHKGVVGFAHRGGNAAGKGKENTLAAFRSAWELGYKYLETDVLLSKDGVVIVYHGIRNSKKAVKAGWPPREQLQSMTLKEIKSSIRIDGEEVPTLKELLDEFPEAFFSIDAKTDEVAIPLVRLLKKEEALYRVFIGSFVYKRTLRMIKEAGGADKVCTVLSGNILLTAGFLRLSSRLLQKHFERSPANCLVLPTYLVSKKLIKAAHRADMKVYVWTLNTRKEMEKALSLGVDGIMSDETVLLKKVLAGDR